MKRGPKPTPTAILRQRGSWRAATRPDEPVMEAKRLTAPSWLPARAKRLFTRCAAILGEARVTTDADALALALLCNSYALYRSACDTLEREGMTVPTRDGGTRPHPAVRIRNAAHEQLMKGLAAFGMTPADRARVQTFALDIPDVEKVQYFEVNDPAVVPATTREGTSR